MEQSVAIVPDKYMTSISTNAKGKDYGYKIRPFKIQGVG